MMVHIPQLLTGAELAQCRAILEASDWVDGKGTAGDQAATAKFNLQIPEGSSAAIEAGDIILRGAGRNPLFKLGGVAASRAAADVQSLRCRHEVRRSCRRCDPRDSGCRHTHAGRYFVDTVSYRSGRLRRRRTGGRRHLRVARGQAPCRRHGALSGDQPAST